ncbi:MAG: CvpA family protein [Firmicutes bacterium]|nr:CvpA family protein [Bacillota bacterium]
MNWFDYLLLGIAAIYIIGGFIQGALKQLFNLFGFFIALALAFMGCRYLSGFSVALLKTDYFLPYVLPYEEVLQRIGIAMIPEEILELTGAVLTFLALLAVLLIFWRLILHWLTRVNKIPVIGFFNRLGGGLLGLLIALLINFALINAASLLPLPLIDDVLQDSVIVGYIELYLPSLVTGLKEVLIEFLLRSREGGEAMGRFFVKFG